MKPKIFFWSSRSGLVGSKRAVIRTGVWVEAGAAALANGCPKLTYINLDGTPVGDTGAAAYFRAPGTLSAPNRACPDSCPFGSL